MEILVAAFAGLVCGVVSTHGSRLQKVIYKGVLALLFIPSFAYCIISNSTLGVVVVGAVMFALTYEAIKDFNK